MTRPTMLIVLALASTGCSNIVLEPLEEPAPNALAMRGSDLSLHGVGLHGGITGATVDPNDVVLFFSNAPQAPSRWWRCRATSLRSGNTSWRCPSR